MLLYLMSENQENLAELAAIFCLKLRNLCHRLAATRVIQVRHVCVNSLERYLRVHLGS